MTPFIAANDLSLALGPPTYLAIFDDANSGSANTNAVDQVIRRAHARVMAWLPDTFTALPAGVPAAIPDLLFAAEIDYAIAFSFQRKPEYVRAYGTSDGSPEYDRAEKTMEEVAASILRLPDFATKPSNVGGLHVDSGARIMVDNADGTSNAGDF